MTDTFVATDTFVKSGVRPAADNAFCRGYSGAVETIGDRLEQLQARLGGISLAKMAEMSGGLPRQTLSHIVRASRTNPGYRPDTETLAKIASGMGVTVEWLLTGRGSPDDAPNTTVPDQPPPTVPTPVAAEGESPLERALGFAFDPTRHTVGDLRAVQDALNDGSFQWQRVEGDLVESARTWLDAASALRREGQHVSTVSILYRVTAGKAARTRTLAATADAEGRRAMEASGPTELDDTVLETTQGSARRVGGRTATTTPFAPDESGPSGIRVVSPGGSPAVPKTAKR